MVDSSLHPAFSGASEGAMPGIYAPQDVLAWSEACVDDRLCRGPYISVWQPAGRTVVLGIGQNPETELCVDSIRSDKVGLVRRQSGGGAVLLYEGVLCWEAWAGCEEIEARTADGSGIRQAYRVLSAPVLAALSGMGLEVFQAGICDISIAGASESPRKIAGTAQLRRKDMVLVHGSILVCPDLDMLQTYLQLPGDQPEYRLNRSHREFCVSVAELLEWNKTADELLGMVAGKIQDAAIDDTWSVAAPRCEIRDDGAVLARAETLVREKYGFPGWNWERKRSALL